jgi:hypothetical protein
MEWVERVLEHARLIGMKELADPKEVFIEQFKPVPTKV